MPDRGVLQRREAWRWRDLPQDTSIPISTNISFENRWWARLTPHGEKNLKGLLYRRELTAAFDVLLDIPGLWMGMKVSTLHKMMAMKCDEVSKPGRGITAS